MNKNKLLIFIQSYNVDLYINIIMHCVTQNNVKEIFFAANKELPGRDNEIRKNIKDIRNKIEELSNSHPIYKKALEVFPSISQVEENIIRMSFIQPELYINDIKRKISESNKLIVDVSGCNKRLSTDVISSFIPNNIVHICCFELENEVYAPKWRNTGKSKLYHDLMDEDMLYYSYVDFYQPGTTKKSFDKMRFQGNIVKMLFIILIFLSVLIFTLIQQQENIYAQIAVVSLSLVATLGLVNDALGLRGY